MLHLFMHPTTSLCAWTWCIWSRLRTLLMLGNGNRGESDQWEMVSMLGNIYQELLYQSSCGELLAKSTVTWLAEIITHSENMTSARLVVERLCSFWRPIFSHRNDSLAANNDCMHLGIQLLGIQWMIVYHWVEHQRRVNEFSSYIFSNQWAAKSYPSRVIVFAVFRGTKECDMLIAPSWKWVSNMHQWFLVLWVW